MAIWTALFCAITVTATDGPVCAVRVLTLTACEGAGLADVGELPGPPDVWMGVAVACTAGVAVAGARRATGPVSSSFVDVTVLGSGVALAAREGRVCAVVGLALTTLAGVACVSVADAERAPGVGGGAEVADRTVEATRVDGAVTKVDGRGADVGLFCGDPASTFTMALLAECSPSAVGVPEPVAGATREVAAFTPGCAGVGPAPPAAAIGLPMTRIARENTAQHSAQPILGWGTCEAVTCHQFITGACVPAAKYATRAVQKICHLQPG
jgi:hypothetical protein